MHLIRISPVCAVGVGTGLGNTGLEGGLLPSQRSPDMENLTIE